MKDAHVSEDLSLHVMEEFLESVVEGQDLGRCQFAVDGEGVVEDLDLRSNDRLNNQLNFNN